MAALTLKVDESKLHPRTARIEKRDGMFAEVNDKGIAVVLHPIDSFVKTGQTHVVWSYAPFRTPAAPHPFEHTAPRVASVEYSQSSIKSLYTQLKVAADKGAGDIDAKSILNQLKAAELSK